MRKFHILRIDSGTYLIHTGPLWEHYSTEGSYTIIARNKVIVEYLLNVSYALRIGRSKEHLHS